MRSCMSQTDRREGRGLVFLVLISVDLLVSAPAWSANQDHVHEAVDQLGELNGIALQCRYIDQVRRMKSAVVAHVPKQRLYGQAFDEATNRSFLKFIEEERTCPSEPTFEREVGHRIDVLQNSVSRE
jgi:hypothetical protein